MSLAPLPVDTNVGNITIRVFVFTIACLSLRMPRSSGYWKTSFSK